MGLARILESFIAVFVVAAFSKRRQVAVGATEVLVLVVCVCVCFGGGGGGPF